MPNRKPFAGNDLRRSVFLIKILLGGLTFGLRIV